MFDPGLGRGQIINNQAIREIFGCSPQGGMRRSLTTNTLVIVSDKTRGVYDDRWEECVLHYTGMGQRGDQELAFAQNKTLAESSTNGVDIHLFEALVPQQYIYQGRVKLVEDPYQEQQPDVDGIQREVWVFPVQLESGEEVVKPPHEALEMQFERREKEASKLAPGDLLRRAKAANSKPGSRGSVTKQYSRDPHVAALVKMIAAGCCHLCGEPAPFQKSTGEPYLEVHHVEWLSKGGDDALHNVVALCPNCHRRMHVLDRADDRRKLASVAEGNEVRANLL
ncbi:HNH endonuclease [Salidesulfovibrio onnuriiensis]|uniref:HNH endonuclease n=1 Tax=Salidesulfovibrio onnuriiensis TaxID=2583823 RepID=UPI0011C7AE33|nr:HNH endonuclease [Salidesulfovibrio onnuriiensis]